MSISIKPRQPGISTRVSPSPRLARTAGSLAGTSTVYSRLEYAGGYSVGECILTAGVNLIEYCVITATYIVIGGESIVEGNLIASGNLICAF